jgi:PST family polysaccharide transporter
VNEQTLVGLLLAGPGVLATLTFAPLVIAIFYSAKFAAAVGILRWICLGAALQVVSWPMGFIIVAKGRQGWFFLSELAWTIVAVVLAWLCIARNGLNGSGIAFFASYIFHIAMSYALARGLTGFRWSSGNRRTGLIFLSLIGLVFCGYYLLPVLWAGAMGTIATAVSGVYVIRTLLKLIPISGVPSSVRWLLAITRLYVPRVGDDSVIPRTLEPSGVLR